MKQPFVLIAIFFLICTSSAQEKLPEYGNISDLKGLSKVYVTAPSTKQRDMILKELKKYPALTVIESPDAAEFFLEYRIVDSHMTRYSIVPIVTAELAAYTIKAGQRRIAWSETKVPKMHPTESVMPNDFIKALKKDRGEKD